MLVEPIVEEPHLDQAHVKSEVETELVRRTKEGDHSAFEQLYRQHVGRVYAVCLRITSDTDHAEELTQDVFVRVWQTIGSFRGESAFSSWLHRVATNVVLVDLRSTKRREARIVAKENVESYDSAARENPPGTSLDLENAIATLPPQARTIFVLHDIEGYRHEEIGEQMGLATGTCKAQLHRARKLLKEVLER